VAHVFNATGPTSPRVNLEVLRLGPVNLLLMVLTCRARSFVYYDVPCITPVLLPISLMPY
jgi:hypothetical protein